jgi:hypothetical protein
MEIALQHIQDSDRIWVYQANRFLTEAEIELIQTAGKTFVASWATHGKPLRAEVAIVYNLFVIVSVDEEQAKASGCSIDKSVNWISALGRELHIDFLDRMQIGYKDEQNVARILPMNEFEQLAANGQIESSALVFNNLVFNGKELKNAWIIPASDSWHSRFFQ